MVYNFHPCELLPCKGIRVINHSYLYTWSRINIQPTTNSIFTTHIHINTTRFLSRLFSFKGTMFTHSNFPVKAAEAINYGSITWCLESSFHAYQLVGNDWQSVPFLPFSSGRVQLYVLNTMLHNGWLMILAPTCVTQTRYFHSAVPFRNTKKLTFLCVFSETLYTEAALKKHHYSSFFKSSHRALPCLVSQYICQKYFLT